MIPSGLRFNVFFDDVVGSCFEVLERCDKLGIPFIVEVFRRIRCLDGVLDRPDLFL